MHETAETIEAWLITRLSQLLGVEATRIEANRPLTRYGLDSIVAIELTTDLEEWLQQPIPTSLLWDEPTIRDIAAYLTRTQEPAGAEAVPHVQASREKYQNNRGKKPGTEQIIADERHESSLAAQSVEPIAIVGLGCRTPGANNIEEFWHLLRNGRDAITDLPIERWDLEGRDEPASATTGNTGSRSGGYLKDIDRFDPYFFHVSPREAAQMDPQQRLLLETAWEALEHAGQSSEKLAGSMVGVFIGISTNDYFKQCAATPEMIDAYTNTGNAHSIAASRLSYFFDWYGPSIAIDTACSSSLVAVHLACQSLRSGESSMALAGGVNVILSSDATIGFAKARMISVNGHCRPFDATADGLIRGEGCGMVVLKRLADARADGDRILATIRGTAMNQDGRSNGLTAPNDQAQQRVIRQALKQAGLSAVQPGYIVAQGTGTPLGDATELRALTAVLGEAQPAGDRCAVTSIKANIGHLEAAAGVVSLIAATLSLQHEEIPPQLHFQHTDPLISLENTRLFIPTTLQNWPRGERARFVGVSAFSFSGTNMHLVVEEGPLNLPTPVSLEQPLHILTASASTEQALQDLLEKYASYIADYPSGTLPDICFTANTGRTHFPNRVAIVAESKEQLSDTLQAFSLGSHQQKLFHGHNGEAGPPKIAFFLSGEGTEYEQMGRDLYETQPVFRAALDQCTDILSLDLEQSLAAMLYPAEYAQSSLQDITSIQTTLFALEYAVAMVWRSWGILPDAVVGYGVGAYVAACLAGALSLEDALQLVIERCRLLQAADQKSASLVVHAAEALVANLLVPYHEQAAIVAIHASDRIVISAPTAILAAIQQDIDRQGIHTSPVSLSYTQHLLHNSAALDTFMRLVSVVPHERFSVPFISTLMGEYRAIDEEFNGIYWRKHLCEPVRFADCLETLYKQGFRCFLEVGPSSTLLEIGQHLLSEDTIVWLQSLGQEQTSDWHCMAATLSALYVQGHSVDWSSFEKDNGGRLISLPTYPFQRERCWVQPAKQQRPIKTQVTSQHPLLGQRVR